MRRYISIIAVLACVALFLSAAGTGVGDSYHEKPGEEISADEMAYPGSRSDEVDVPTFEIGSSWTYSQDLWQNDTEEEEYVYLQEEITYTVESVEHFYRGNDSYWGYNISMAGDILDGDIDNPDIPIGTVDIDGGYIEGYQFLKMSDLAVVEDRQFRYYHSDYMGMEIEGWMYMNQSHQVPTEHHDFPISVEDQFWSNTTRRSWGYNKVDAQEQEEEWFDDMIDCRGENNVFDKESIEVPAGNFESYPLMKTVSGDNEGNQQRWYSPEVGSSVREVIQGDEADIIRELKDYDPIEPSNELSIDPSEGEIGEEVTLSGQFPDNPDEYIDLSIPEGAEPKSEWKTETDEEGKFDETIEVPVAEDMTETKVDFSTVGFVAEVTDEDIEGYAVSTLVIHHDNSPVLPEPEDGCEDVDLNPELSVVAAHRQGEEVDITFYDDSDDSQIGFNESVPSGDRGSVIWDDLEVDSSYGWYAVADDGEETFESEVWSFTTEEEETESFDIKIISPDDNDEFVEGGTVTVEYEVENTGDVAGTQDIEFLVADGVYEDEEKVADLPPGGVYEGDFEWHTSEGEVGEYDIEVSSEDAADQVSVTILEDKKDDYELQINTEEGGTTDPEPGTHPYLEGTEVTVKAIPEEGWYFEEWTGDYEGTEEEITLTMDEDKEITAVFEAEQRELTIDIEGEGTTDPEEGTHEYDHGEEVTITATPSEDWYFEGWTGDHEGTEEEMIVTMDEDKWLTARFETDLDFYELTIDIEGEGKTDPEEGSHTFEEGSEVSVTATADEGWYFEEWTGAHESEKEEITITMDEDKEITAVFEAEQRELTIDIEGEGTTDPEEGTHEYDHGEEVTITATPSEDWYFEGWTGDHEGTEEEMIVTMDEDKWLTARFETDLDFHELTINIDGEGSTDLEEGSHTFEEGSEVSVTATADEGWNLVEWTGDYEGTEEEITITMDEDKEITAVFEEDGEIPPEEDEEDDDEEDGGFVSNYWWVIVVLLIGMIAVVAMLFTMKGKEEDGSIEEQSYEDRSSSDEGSYHSETSSEEDITEES